MYLMWVLRRRCGEKGAERGRGLGPWTVQESLREGVEGRRVEAVVDALEVDGVDCSSR